MIYCSKRDKSLVQAARFWKAALHLPGGIAARCHAAGEHLQIERARRARRRPASRLIGLSLTQKLGFAAMRRPSLRAQT